MTMELADCFWIYNPRALFATCELSPSKCMTNGRKMNAVTRLFLVCMLVALAVAWVSPRVDTIYMPLLIGIIVIIVVYLINSRRATMENFSPCQTDVNVNALLDYVHAPPPINNPRFNTPPPYIPPSHNLDDWKQSTFAEHSAVNGNKGGYSLRTSGYKFTDASVNCGINSPHANCDEKVLPFRACNLPRTPINTSCSPSSSPSSVTIVPGDAGAGDTVATITANTVSATNKVPVYKVGDPFSRYTCEKNCTKGRTGVIDIKSDRCVAFPGDLIEHCGYNPEKGSLAGMPHNQPMSIDDYFPTLKKYHEDLNTQIIDPSGVYTTTEVNEPQMTNLGISFPQQFQPLEELKDCDKTLIVRRNPRLFTPIQKVYDYGEITPDSIYDPRSGGYGDARRTYIDQVTGQPRFYYDDINAGRESNFITRNKIDVYNFTNQVGIFNERVNDNVLETVKPQVHDAFITNGNDHRHSLQQSLMRKGNEKARQQRLAPLRRDVPTRTMK